MDEISSFELYVSQESKPLTSGDITVVELEFLAASNAFGGEAGELQNIVKKIMRAGLYGADDPLWKEFALEAGDVLHYLVRLINSGGFFLSEIQALNIAKLEARKLNDAKADPSSEVAP